MQYNLIARYIKVLSFFVVDIHVPVFNLAYQQHINQSVNTGNKLRNVGT